MLLYDKPIKGADKLPVSDLRQIARFNRIVKNYHKMLRIERRAQNGSGVRPEDKNAK